MGCGFGDLVEWMWRCAFLEFGSCEISCIREIRIRSVHCSKTPQERFAQHKTGALSRKGHDLSSAIVKKYGRYLRPSLYQHIGPLSRAEALEVEKGLALELRRKGYAVWTN